MSAYRKYRSQNFGLCNFSFSSTLSVFQPPLAVTLASKCPCHRNPDSKTILIMSDFREIHSSLKFNIALIKGALILSIRNMHSSKIVSFLCY